MIKKRVFAPGEDERPSNIPLIAIGLGLLWFGWLGDNPAGAMHANGMAAQAFVNTFIAGGLAMLVWMFTDWVRIGKASMVGALTGVLAGLVAVTPAAGYVPTWAAAFIALAAGWICYGATHLRAARGWDDSLDVWGVHGVGGLMGTVLVGWFAYASVGGHNGLIAGNGKQFGLQLAAVGDHSHVRLRRELRHPQGDRHGGHGRRDEQSADRRPRPGTPRRDRLRPDVS